MRWFLLLVLFGLPACLDDDEEFVPNMPSDGGVDAATEAQAEDDAGSE